MEIIKNKGIVDGCSNCPFIINSSENIMLFNSICVLNKTYSISEDNVQYDKSFRPTWCLLEKGPINIKIKKFSGE